MTARKLASPDRPGLAELASLAEPAVIADPYPLYARMRAASPFTELDGALVVIAGYEDCSRILRDARASSARADSLLTPPQQRDGRDRAPSFLSLDPPDHTRLRGLVAKAFTPRVVATLAPRIEQITGELLDAARAAGGHELELIGQLAYPLPVRVISGLLGVPPQDHAKFAGWSARLAHSVQPSFGAADPAEVARAEQAAGEFRDYFTGLIASRRADPADDLLTRLIRVQDDGQRLTTEELIATCVLLLVAGHETTVGLIANAMLALLRDPAQLAALTADPGLAASAVEETLRYDPPVQLTGRVARSGLSIGELTPRDGAVLLLLLAATGRDEAVFADPDLFDIRRGQSGIRQHSGQSGIRQHSGRSGTGQHSRRDHLAFSAGPHFCLGAPLARLEATIALTAIARRVVAPELDETALTYKPNFNLRGPERMKITYADIASS